MDIRKQQNAVAVEDGAPPGKDPMDTGGGRNWLLILAGPVVAFVLTLLLPGSLTFEARAIAGIAIWMALWWMTEAVPIPATSLLPLILFPLVGAGTLEEVASPYANSVIFLVLGGVILGLATQKSNLHLRVALLTIKIVGTKPAQIVLGLMIASAFISMWVSSTATAVIMVPIASSIIQLVRKVDSRAAGKKFSAAMILGVGYGVTMGSMATIIGQPPMALMTAYLRESHSFEMGFGQWMIVGVPFALVMTAACWLVLTKIVFRPEMNDIPGGDELIRKEHRNLGSMRTAEKRIALVFLVAIFFWVAVPFIAEIAVIQDYLPFLESISDAQVAIAAAMACFIVPAEKRRDNPKSGALLTWSATREVPWGLLLLFGGGLSLSAMFTATGLSEWVGTQVSGLSFLPGWAIVLAVIIVGLALTELTSNTATAAAFFPIFGAVAVAVGVDPLIMTIAVAMAVCSAYMLPVATPSNAVAFGSGEITIKQMVRAGVWMNMISMVMIMIVLHTLVPLAFNVSL